MFLNLSGKFLYLNHLLSAYGLGVFSKSVLGLPITKLKLKNGTIIQGDRKSQLLEITDEIFFKRLYTPDFLQIECKDVVVDVGANVGIFSLFAANCGAKKIYAFEPLPSNIKTIKRNFKNNKIFDAIVEQVAISGKVGKARFYLGRKNSHGQLIDHNLIEKFPKYIEVPTKTLEEIISEYKIKKVDFLKIDCEGSEGEILISTPKRVWERIKKLSLEYHDGISKLNHQEIVKKLKKAGFKTRLAYDGSAFGYIYAWR